jgi:hypothetical protein
MSNKRVFETNAEHVYPVESPDLSLDFINSRGIDPAYSFTRNSSATYVGSDGLIKTAAVNQPRFDFDPVTGECKGLLVEEGRTNLLTYSTTFDVAWTDTNIIRNTTTALAPDGTNSALRVTAGNDNATIIRNSAVGSTNTRTFSIYLRRVSGSGLIQFTINGGSSWTTLTQSITNTWSRFILITTRSNHRVGLRIVTAGDSIELWGSQLEVGVETSYIPTTTTTVTRQPDQLILNRSLNTQGTLYVESRPTSGTSVVADNGSSLLSVPQEPNQYSKSVLYYNNNRILRMSSDGGVPVDYSSILAPQDLNRVSLGFNRLSNSSYINGHLKKFSYYSSPLTEDNLRALTGNKRSITQFTSFGEPIVTSNLVLYLDAGNLASYPGSGTTWTDLSGNGNTGTLVNGVGYSGDNLGSLVFDGVNDYVSFVSNSSLTPTSMSLFCFLYTKNLRSEEVICVANPSNGLDQGWRFLSRSFQGTVWQFQPAAGRNFVSGQVLSNNNWYSLAVTYQLSGNIILYLNGISSNSAPATNALVHGTSVRIGTGIGSQQSFLQANLPIFMMYNRVLTAEEISQNFNALRGRFGI